MAKSKIEDKIHCSFCGKGNSEVDNIIAASDKTCICDECVMRCLHIIIYGKPKPVTINLDDNESEDVKCTKEQSESTA